MTPQQTWSFHDASLRVGEGRGWSCLPPGAVRSCHRTGSRAVTGRGLGLPAVTSLTLAETIHLVWRGPPWVERGTCRSPEPACTGRQECTQAAVDTLHRHIRKCTDIKRPAPLHAPAAPGLFPALTGTIRSAVRMNHSPADRSRKQK